MTKETAPPEVERVTMKTNEGGTVLIPAPTIPAKLPETKEKKDA